MAEKSIASELEHQHLWMLFKPGCLVYQKIEGIESLVRLRAIYEEADDADELSWHLSVENINYSANDIGLVRTYTEIKHYDGRKPILEMTAVPLYLHPEEERIRYDLLERGRKFLSFRGTQHCFYDGVAYLCSMLSPSAYDKKRTNVCISTFHWPRLSLTNVKSK